MTSYKIAFAKLLKLSEQPTFQCETVLFKDRRVNGQRGDLTCEDLIVDFLVHERWLSFQ